MTRRHQTVSRAIAVALAPASLWFIACDRHDDPGAPTNRARTEASVSRSEPEQSPTPINPLPSPVEPPKPTDASKARVDDEADAEAKLKAVDGDDTEVEAKFYAVAGGVRVVAEVDDAKPGKHGFHVHEKGDCSDLKGKSMGAHFSPDKHDHALPNEGGAKHLGDLGNVIVDDKGDGRFEITVPGATLEPNGAKSFLGKALVFHQSEDTGKKAQPSGGSGDPIACGVIEKT